MRQFFARFKYFTATLLFLLTTAMSSGGAVFAYSMTNPNNDYKKVYVCKYVGTPGTNERLQTGGNPIDVSANALKNFTGIGSFFNDAQGRSVAIAWDSGDNADPSVSMCPSPAPDQIPVPATPGLNDPCGVSNATWVKPADTATVTWSIVSGHLIATTTTGNVFVGGSTTHDYGLATDSNVLCPPTEVSVPATPGVNDPCGLNNAVWIVPSNTATITWAVTNGHLIATTTAGNVFVGGGTTHDYGLAVDSNTACPLTPVTPNGVTFVDLCGTGNDKYTIPATTGVNYQINGQTVAAGTYSGTGAVTVTAVAQANYTLTGTTSWNNTFTNVPCDVPVTPTPPVILHDNCGLDDDSYTIPSTPHVNYTFNSAILQPGPHSTYRATSVTIVAYAQTGYVLSGDGSWTLNFTNAPCPCGCSENPPVEADTPSFMDVCGIENDKYTIPSTEHVKYYVNGSIIPTPAGTYSATGTVSVVAVADQGYTLEGTHSWSHKFTNMPCVVKVRPPKVEFKDLCEMKNDTFTIPSKTGVEYWVNGHVLAAGTYNANDYEVNGTVTVTAVAKAGYVLKGHTHMWSMHFTNEECGGGGGEQTPATPGAATFTDVCATANDTYTIPVTVGVTYKVNGVVTAAGTYPATGTVTVTAEAQAGFVLSGTTSWTHTFTDESCGQVLGESTVVFTPTPGKGAAAELANTGQNSLTSAIVAFVIATSAILVYAFAPKRQLS